MTHKEAEARRARIAEFVKANPGMTMTDAGRKFGVSKFVVSLACQTHGVIRKKGLGSTSHPKYRPVVERIAELQAEIEKLKAEVR